MNDINGFKNKIINENNKSKGVTNTEELLVSLCDSTFLKFWSFPNPVKDDGHEFCDLLVVFNNTVFIFFDRERNLKNINKNSLEVEWKRWKKKAVEKQIKTANGAERYILSGRKIYIDNKKKIELPIIYDPENLEIYKFVIAHGITNDCKNHSSENIYGSLAIHYGKEPIKLDCPFLINLDSDCPVHILDSFNLKLVLNELDTIADFESYIAAKELAIKKYESLMYCGEEDLLAHYLQNYDNNLIRHFIGANDLESYGIIIGEGEWRDFIKKDFYKRTKIENENSYVWDELIQITYDHFEKNTLTGLDLAVKEPLAAKEMAKEPRMIRRVNSEKIKSSMEKFSQVSNESFFRMVSLMPSISSKNAYIFLQLQLPVDILINKDVLLVCQNTLSIACGAAKNKFNKFETIIGLCIVYQPMQPIQETLFLHMDCKNWDSERENEFLKLNEDFKFFQTSDLTQSMVNVREFV